ncbi:NUDIX domain-containing protein [Actinomadura viridis]|uniref:8-oxo-dGTP pyrophosphatase MutT (NUDIX family) n=1 Tax=Actinomadura viridis TaxID=58110 RepID=A0A931GPP4_9ACTN|nr:NUDIX domain-containing protein [Actinomadura viridis]MBG6087619.1 8-oxo-dGTP pyrophosphatase MutT (NUDIX family) [Actinomadura viridis]
MEGDGDGWARCSRGHTHWGRHGAAGLLAYHRDERGDVQVLLQQRAWWGLGGGTWGMFGGATHSHEDPITGALRETAEECTLDTSRVTVHGVRTEDHGGWHFASVVGSLPALEKVRPASRETRRAAWVPLEEVTRKRLFPPFAACWPLLSQALKRLVLVVDAANVVGARADGWWKDRPGANARLRDELAVLKDGVSGIPEGLLPYDSCFPEVVLVVEGEAREIAGRPGDAGGVRVVAAPGSGDDEIVGLVSRRDPGAAYLVVTADRELRARSEAAGAAVVGPRWLLGCLTG